MSDALQFQPVLVPADVAVVADLAKTIWYEYYVPLIGRAQVDYMVARFQSAAAMQAQIDEGYEYFLVRPSNEAAPVGYIGVHFQCESVDQEATIFISKLYLLADARGSGTGRAMLEFIETLARQRRARSLWLTVNKGNPAVLTYERWGFIKARAIVMDIGGGFVMDDYRMEKSVESAP